MATHADDLKQMPSGVMGPIGPAGHSLKRKFEAGGGQDMQHVLHCGVALGVDYKYLALQYKNAGVPVLLPRQAHSPCDIDR
jgi:hypothetical protein